MSYIRRQWFLLVLFAVLSIGFWRAPSLEWIVRVAWFKWSVVTVTMFLMSWPLAFHRLYRAMTRPLGPLLATVLNLGVIPLLAWPLSWYLGPELGGGLIVAASVPTTLATGVVWTRRAGGDDSVAIMVTLITNGLCFLVTPTWVYLLTGNEVDRAAFVATIYKLFFFVVLPMTAGQLARLHTGSARWVTRHYLALGVAAQIGVLIIVLTGAIRTGMRLQQEGASSLSVPAFLQMAVAVVGLHLFVLVLGFALARAIGIPRKEQIAVAFSGSQKTLMVGLSTAISLGLNIIPLVTYHALQLVVDAMIADRLRARGEGAVHGDADNG